MKPFEKGALDALEGVYNIVNALCKIYKKKEGEKFFKDIISYLEKNKKITATLTTGISKATITGIFENIFGNKIILDIPFKQNKDITLDKFWNSLTSFLSDDDDTAILICREENGKKHWTVIESVSNKQLHLFDSFSLKHLNRKHCTTSKDANGRHHILIPSHTFFIKKT